MDATIGGLLEKSIEDFANEIELESDTLDIDTDCEDLEGKPYLKVVNHELKDAYAVYLDTIVTHYKDGILKDLVRALRTGEFIRLNGVTRVVGYYSRIQNWNKSKANLVGGKVGGELGDRMRGNYWDSKRVNTGPEWNRH